MLDRSEIEIDRVILPPEQLERKLYERVNAVLVNAGGKWDRRTRSHLFKGDPRVKLGLAMDTGVAVDEKKLFQAFYTPPELAVKVVKLASVCGEVVLEPSAGAGALADECKRQGARSVTCVEIRDGAGALLTTKGHTFWCIGDFLKAKPQSDKLYSRIVANPPFTKNQDVKHVTHMLKFLKPDGRLVAIMGGSITRAPFVRLLAHLDDENCAWEIIHNDKNSFKESGTCVNTITLVVDGPEGRA